MSVKRGYCSDNFESHSFHLIETIIAMSIANSKPVALVLNVFNVCRVELGELIKYLPGNINEFDEKDIIIFFQPQVRLIGFTCIFFS